MRAAIWSIALLLSAIAAGARSTGGSFDFYGQSIQLSADFAGATATPPELTTEGIETCYKQLEGSAYKQVVAELARYRQTQRPDDWLFYQLIRKTAEQVSPKAENYPRYTLYKWFLLNKLGYDAILSTDGERLLMYVQSNDNIYNIPFRMKDGKKYACLNYHDYGYDIDFSTAEFKAVDVALTGEKVTFSYQLTRLPEFRPEDYSEKEIAFSYADATYRFKIKINEEVKKILVNYPVMDYHAYYNIPMSSETYNSLIPQLKNDLKGKSVKSGVSFLMHFTRYSFLYTPDNENFGREKRLSPEQTLLYEASDCEDRVALFFYLVKEIYNLPMIVLAYPDHVSIAVAFDKPVGTPIMYNGKAYSICEPTPQRKDLPVGKMPRSRSNMAYEVMYAYQP
ncbi:MAG: hypothetical protein JNL72_08530 [Flavipsychrobacter sp.]|nr:hypothetical protein [Flavipsychrobacter sp.]